MIGVTFDLTVAFGGGVAALPFLGAGCTGSGELSLLISGFRAVDFVAAGNALGVDGTALSTLEAARVAVARVVLAVGAGTVEGCSLDFP